MISPPIFLIVDDHPLFRAALRQTLQAQSNRPEVFEAQDVDSLQQAIIDLPTISLILLDLHMPGAHGFSSLIHLNSQAPHIPVIVISADDSEDITRRAIHHGAAGFLSKSSSTQEVGKAIETVLAGGTAIPFGTNLEGNLSDAEERAVANVLGTLTPQQFRVTTMLSQGLLNKQIAYELDVTEATVKAHLTEIFKKLGVHSRTQAVLAISKLDIQAKV